MAIVAPYLSYFVQAIIANVIGQGISIAVGAQDKFSWSSLGMAAIGGAVGTTGIGEGVSQAFGGGISGAIASAMTTNVVTQGIAVGLQDKFSWQSVAAAGISAGVNQAIGESQYEGDWDAERGRAATGKSDFGKAK